MPTPYEVTSGAGLQNEDLQRRFAEQLRRNRDVSTLSMLTGDSRLGAFGQALGVDNRSMEGDALSGRNAELNRQMTGKYYDQQAGQSALRNAMDMLELQERERHNRAMEANKTNGQTADVRRLAQELTKNNIPEIQSGIAQINAELEKHGGNLPGVGGAANLLPSFTSDGRAMQDRIAKIRNIILKARSGGAVTPQEADRLLQEFSLRGFNSDEDFLRAWGDFTRAFDSGVANIYAGYPSEVVEQHNANLARERIQDVKPEAKAPSGGVNWSDL